MKQITLPIPTFVPKPYHRFLFSFFYNQFNLIVLVIITIYSEAKVANNEHSAFQSHIKHMKTSEEIDQTFGSIFCIFFERESWSLDYLIFVITELAESHPWLVQAENIAVPVLYLICQFSVKAEYNVRN